MGLSCVAVSMARVFHICCTHTIVVMVGFEQPSYTVGETSPVLDVCVWLSGASFSTTTMLRPVTLRVAIQGDTATQLWVKWLPLHMHRHTHSGSQTVVAFSPSWDVRICSIIHVVSFGTEKIELFLLQLMLFLAITEVSAILQLCLNDRQ